MQKEYFVNGPVNVVRLEKDGKVVYIYGDIHKDLYNQSVCDPINSSKESIDLDKLLIKIIKKYPEKQFNLMLEVDDMKIIDNTINVQSIYIEQIRKLGKYKFPNLKSFNVDNRYKILNKNPHLLNSLYDDDDCPTSYYSINYTIIRQVLNFLSEYQLIINLILKKISGKKIYEKHVQSIESIAEFLKLNVSQLTEVIKRMKTSYIPHVEGQQITMQLCSACFNIKYMLQLIFACVQDSNMINILSKTDNRSINIYYCGLYHMINTAHVLVNEHNYKITHALYGNINEIESKLKEVKVSYDIETSNIIRQLFNIDKTILQCINLEHFPDNLL